MESTQLQSACVSLGFKERNGYSLEPDCLATVKLLIRFLRNEYDGHSVRWQLGFSSIVQNDLIPIMQFHSENKELTDAVLRLLLNLSQPTLVCFNGRVPSDGPTRKLFMELDQYLCGYKQAFADADFLKVITASMAGLVKKDHEDKLREEDRLVLERYLLLIRNVLHIDESKQHSYGMAGENLLGTSTHDDLLLAINRSGLDRLLLYLATSAEEHGYALHILEILWLLFKDITPSLLVESCKAKDGEASGGVGLVKLTAEDLDLVRQPLARKAATAYRAELRGTFAVKSRWTAKEAATGPSSTDSSSSMVIHRHSGPNDTASALQVIGSSKKRSKKSSQRDIALEDTLEKDRCDMIATVRPRVRDFLAGFARRLLVDASGYNSLMAAADRVMTGAPADSHDESFYLWALAFFMELARGLLPSLATAVECVGQTLGIEALTFVHTHLSTYADGLDTDRFDKEMWNKRLVLATRAFGEQMAWAETLARCRDEAGVASLGRTLVLNIVYEPQFRDLLPQLLRRYKESRHCRAFLRCLVAAVHTQLKLIDYLKDSCGKDTLVVAAPTKLTRKQKPQNQKQASKEKTKKKKKKQPSKYLLFKQPWEDVGPRLQQALLARQATEKNDEGQAQQAADTVDESDEHPLVRATVAPAVSQSCDDPAAASRASLDKIGQLLLRHDNAKLTVAAVRLARKLFPENCDCFGGAEPTLSEEMVFFESFYQSLTSVVDDDDDDDNGEEKENNSVQLADEDQETDEDEDEERLLGSVGLRSESQTNAADLAAKFCSVASLQPYVVLLEAWATNPAATNHHVARFLKRVAIDWALPAMLYQLRIFQVCQALLRAHHHQTSGSNAAKELVSFANFAVAGFFQLAKRVGKAAFLEILFWKNRPDALAFAENYESLQVMQDETGQTAAGGVQKRKLTTKRHRVASRDESPEKELLPASKPAASSSDDMEDDEAWLRFRKSTGNIAGDDGTAMAANDMPKEQLQQQKMMKKKISKKRTTIKANDSDRKAPISRHQQEASRDEARDAERSPTSRRAHDKDSSDLNAGTHDDDSPIFCKRPKLTVSHLPGLDDSLSSLELEIEDEALKVYQECQSVTSLLGASKAKMTDKSTKVDSSDDSSLEFGITHGEQNAVATVIRRSGKIDDDEESNDDNKYLQPVARKGRRLLSSSESEND